MAYHRVNLLRLAVLGLVLLGAGRARAETEDARESAARTNFGAGNYQKALQGYLQLYTEHPHPVYLRNIGRCYQNLGDTEKAISSFREYLRQSPELEPKQRALVEGYIKEMQDLERRRRSEGGGDAVIDSSAAAGAQAEEPAAPAGDSRRVAAYVVGAASVAALVTGGVFGLQARSRNNEAEPLCPMNACNDRGYDLSGQATSAAHVADVAFGVGLVGGAVATYLFLTSGSPAASAPGAHALRVQPLLGAHGAGLLAGASW